ncbi:MAG: hypothetical protein NT013_18810 [Planctomycetia bacterium]|nr:hypothetical protein [Planctomycetia bacterium]
MESFRSLQIVVAFLATTPLLNPIWLRPVFGDDQTAVLPAAYRTATRSPDIRPIDVALETGNTLSGRVVTSLDQPITSAELVVTQGRLEISRVVTSAVGDFQVQLPRGGVYLLTTARSTLLVRTWTEAAAPPAAIHMVVMVERFVVRGQDEDCEPTRGHGKGLMLLAITAALAAAIVIPLVILDRHVDLEKETPATP